MKEEMQETEGREGKGRTQGRGGQIDDLHLERQEGEHEWKGCNHTGLLSPIDVKELKSYRKHSILLQFDDKKADIIWKQVEAFISSNCLKWVPHISMASIPNIVDIFALQRESQKRTVVQYT